jgi:hypothetical protein
MGEMAARTEAASTCGNACGTVQAQVAWRVSAVGRWGGAVSEAFNSWACCEAVASGPWGIWQERAGAGTMSSLASMSAPLARSLSMRPG